MSSLRPSGAGATPASPSSQCIVDTDVISFLFRGDTRDGFYRDYLLGKQPGISFQTLAELRRWALVHHWGAPRQRNLAHFLERYTLYLIDEVLIEAWAIINQRVQAKGLLVATGDAWIAATAWVQRVPLVTHNRRHFQIIDGLEVISAEADEAPMP